MDEYVNVPMVLDDSLKNSVIVANDNDPAFFNRLPHVRNLLWDGFKDNYANLIAHYKANPVVAKEPSDDAKGHNFYRTKARRERPEWGPCEVNLPRQISWAGKIIGPGVLEANFDGAMVSVETSPGKWLRLFEDQYEVTKWRKNEADNEG